VTSQESDTLATRGGGSGIPLIPHGFVERPRLRSLLNASQDASLIVVRGSGGSGKSGLVAWWLRDSSPVPAHGQRALWVSLDDGAHSRASFWRRIVGAFQAVGAVTDDSPLSNVILGYAGLDDVPGLVLAQLEHDQIKTHLVLDDFHTVDEDNTLDVLWLLKQSRWLRVTITTRRRGRFEDVDVAARIHSTVITEEELAFTAEETDTLIVNDSRFSAEHARVVHAATNGHPLATRIAATLLLQRPQLLNATMAESESLTRQLSASIAQSLLPAFADPRHLEFATVVALPPELPVALASALSGRAPADVRVLLDDFTNEGLGEYRQVGAELVFRFHPLVSEALRLRAMRTLSDRQLNSAQLESARHLSLAGNGLEALKLFIAAGEYELVWPTMAEHFSELIIYQQDELHALLSSLPPDILARHGTAAISLAIVMSEREQMPSARLRQLVAQGIDDIDSRDTGSRPEQTLLLSLARFAGFRAARRYEDAAAEGDRFVAQIETLFPSLPQASVHSAGAGLVQVAITHILLGHWRRALHVAHLISADDHEGRAQHRVGLLAYVYAFTGHMHEAARQLEQITHADRPGWRTSVPSTGWHIAMALGALESGNVDRGLAMISALDARLTHLEHWPVVLWTRARLRLADGHPDIALDELESGMQQNEFRPLSEYARTLLQSMKADLHLALGERERAQRELSKIPATSTSYAPLLSRKRLALASADNTVAADDFDLDAIREHGTAREYAEALLLNAADKTRRGQEESALTSLRRAADVMSRHGLTSPSMMVPHGDLGALAVSRAPELAGLFDSGPGAYSHIALVNPLTPREREVLATLARGSTLHEVAGTLFVSVNTVKSQLRSAYRKLGVTSGTDAVRVATDRGYIPRN